MLSVVYFFYYLLVAKSINICVSNSDHACEDGTTILSQDFESAFEILCDINTTTTINFLIDDSEVVLRKGFFYNNSEDKTFELSFIGIMEKPSSLKVETIDPLRNIRFSNLSFTNIKFFLSMNSSYTDSYTLNKDNSSLFKIEGSNAISIKNCTFTSIGNSFPSLFDIFNASIIIEETSFESLCVNFVFSNFSIGGVYILNSNFVNSTMGSLIDGSSLEIKVLDSNFTNLNIRNFFIKIENFTSMHFNNSNFVNIVTKDDAIGFIVVKIGNRVDFNTCSFQRFSLMNTKFIFINESLKLSLNLNHSKFWNFSTSFSPIILDSNSNAESNILSINDCLFNTFQINYASMIIVDSRRSKLLIENSWFVNFTFNTSQSKQDGILIEIIRRYCSSSIKNTVFTKFSGPEIVISHLYDNTLLMVNCFFYDISLSQSSSIIDFALYNQIYIISLFIMNVNDQFESNKIFDKGTIFNGEIGNLISITNFTLRNSLWYLSSELLYFYNLNNITLSSISLINLIYLNKDGEAIFIFINLIWGNQLKITEQLNEEQNFNAEEDYSIEYNSIIFSFYNTVIIDNCLINLTSMFLASFLKSTDDSSLNNVYLNSSIIRVDINTKIFKIFELMSGEKFSISGVKIYFDQFYYVPECTVISSEMNNLIEIFNLTISGFGWKVLGDHESKKIFMNQIIVENHNHRLEDNENNNIFFFTNEQTIDIVNLVFNNMALTCGIYIGNVSLFSLSHSSFTNIIILTENSLIQSINTKFILKNNHFQDNLGYPFGLISVDLTEPSRSVEIIGNTFLKNKATKNLQKNLFSKGGALYLKYNGYSFSDQLPIKLCGNNFTQNSAEMGSAIYTEFDPRNAWQSCGNSTNSFKENFAFYSKDIATVIERFELTINYNYKEVNNQSKRLFLVTGYDYFNNRYDTFDFDLNISDEPHKNFSFKTEYLDNSLYLSLKKYNETSLVSEKEKKTLINISEIINISLIGAGVNHVKIKAYSLYFNFTFQCSAGYFFDSSEFECKPCQENTMKLRRSVDLQCDFCNSRKILSCKGGNSIILREGYFKAENSPLIFRCKNLKACFNSNCTDGYKNDSFICSKCNENSGLTLGWECIDCSNPISYISFAISMIITIFFKAYSVKKAYKLTKNLKNKKEKNYYKPKNYSIFQLATTNSCLKIINIHMSFIFSLNSYPFGALETLKNSSREKWLTGLSWVLDSLKFSLECVFKAFGVKNFRGVLVAMLARIIQPVIIVLIWIIYYSYKIYMNKRKKQRNKLLRSNSSQSSLKRHESVFYKQKHHKSVFYHNLVIEVMKSHYLESISLIALSISYEEIITGLSYYLFYFDSKENEVATRRMLHEPDTKVDESKYAIFSPFLIVLIIIFGFLVPLYIIGRLSYAKRLSEKSKKGITRSENAHAFELNPLESYKIFVKYGYFYYQYKKSHYYYEIFYMLKRMVYMTFNVFLIPVIAIHTKYDENIAAFINFEVILIWIFFLIHSYSTPFRSELRAVNNLESQSAIILLTSYFFSALFFNNTDPTNPDDADIIRANFVLYIGIWGLNLFFFAHGFWILLKNEKHNIIKFLGSCRTLLCCLLKAIPIIFVWVCTCFKKGSLKNLTFIRKLMSSDDSTGNNIPEGIEINPLAHWKSGKSKDFEKYLHQNSEDASIIKILKAKIVNLTLLAKYQRREIKELNKRLDQLSQSLAFAKSPKFQGESINSFTEMNESLKINSFHQGISSNLRLIQDFPPNRNAEIEGMNDILIQEEPSPNKVLNTVSDFKIYNSLPDGTAKEKEADSELAMKECGVDSFLDSVSRSIEDDLNIIIIKSVIGNNFKDFFIKTKMTIRNRFENIELTEMKLHMSSELYVKWKRKLDFPCVLGVQKLMKMVFYMKEKNLSHDSSIEIAFQISYKGTNFTKKISINYQDLDFLKLEKFNCLETYFLPISLKKASKSVIVDFQYHRHIGPFEKNNVLDILKYSFPELFNEERVSSDQSPLLRHHKSKYIKRMGMKVESKGSRETFFSKIAGRSHEPLKKTGKFHILRYKLQLNIEIVTADNQANILFKDLHHPRNEPPDLTEENIKGILNMFLETRLS